MEFLTWEALVEAGATLDELEKWERREYPRQFIARVVAWYQYHKLVGLHQEDAARPKRGK